MRPRVLLVSIVLVTNSCTRSIVQTAPVQDVIGQYNRPKDLIVTTRDGQVVSLWSATIVGDTIEGFSRRGDDIRRVRRTVARTDVQSVSIRKTDPVMTTALVLALGAAGFVVLVGSALSGGLSR